MLVLNTRGVSRTLYFPTAGEDSRKTMDSFDNSASRAFWQFWNAGTRVHYGSIRLYICMDALDALAVRAGRVKSLAATENTDNESSDDEIENGISRATRLLQFVKVLLATVATALTIARMLGWL